MADSTPVPSTPIGPTVGDRLDSWKEIAGYLRRDVKTVQRWEKREAMPVHRHVHDKLGSVYAFRSELDAWSRDRRPTQDEAATTAVVDGPSAPPRQRAWLVGVGAAAVIVAVGAVILWRAPPPSENPLATARFLSLTDFNGIEQAAAISRDGKLAAFLSDRDGQMDVWVTQIGSGEFHNLTRGTARDLLNPSVRTVGFSPDGASVTFWARRFDLSHPSDIGIWQVPILGGSPRVYLDGVAEYDWSSDAARVVYHTPGPGDPTFVRNAGDRSPANQIFSAPSGLHSHFPLWSPDSAFIYFVQGSVPDRMDVWRVASTGGTPERITNHDAAVSYPVFLDGRTLLYLATDPDGSGPWIYSIDVERRAPRRVSAGIDRYTSLAVSSDGGRVVATHASPKRTLWRVPLGPEPANASGARAVQLKTTNGSSPRFGPGFVVYVSPKGTGDGIWKLEGTAATELWSSPEARVIGGPALTRDGRLAFSTRRHTGEASLWVIDGDGTDVRSLATPFEVRGAPAWAPDGHSIAVAGLVDGVPSLFTVPIDGGTPTRLVREASSDPVWSPDGSLVVFSGADVGTTFPVKAVTAQGDGRSTPPLTLTRGARHMAFLPGGRSLVVLRGQTAQRNLWAIDLDTGAERQLTRFDPGFDIRDFDISLDGREFVIEQVEEHSDVVLIELQQ